MTSAIWHFFSVAAVNLQPFTGVMSVTVPTFTPAIRTNDCGRSPFALENSAWTVTLPANGFANLVYAR